MNRGTHCGCRVVFRGSYGLCDHLIPHFASVATTVCTLLHFHICPLPSSHPQVLRSPCAAMASAQQQSEGSMSASSQTSAEKSQSSQPFKVMEPDEYWKTSTTKVKDLNKLREQGLLPDP